MNIGFIKKFIPSVGLLLSLTLIGILLLGAVLYYNAVRSQRFLEPALAISQPRIEFAENILRLMRKEFGAKERRGIIVTTNSILVKDSMLFDSKGKPTTPVVKKLSRIFLSMLKDPDMSARVDFILISTRPPLSPNPALNKKQRAEMSLMADDILRAMFQYETELEVNYSLYLASTAYPAGMTGAKTGWVEFKIVPTEQLHIDVLQRLGKYVD